MLHYTATERDDTPFWRHCRAIQKPASLQQRWEMYEQNGNIIIEAGVLFREPSWFAVLDGQGLRPKSYHPFADIPPNEELATTLRAHERRRSKARRHVPDARRLSPPALRRSALKEKMA